MTSTPPWTRRCPRARVREWAGWPTPALAMKVDVRPGWVGLDEGRWNGLLDQAKVPSVFLSWQWQTHWAKSFAPDNSVQLLTVADEDGRLGGLLPLYEEKPGQLRILGGVDVSD